MLRKTGKSCNISVNKSSSFSQVRTKVMNKGKEPCSSHTTTQSQHCGQQPQFLLPSSIQHNRKLNFYLFKFGSKSLDTNSLTTD